MDHVHNMFLSFVDVDEVIQFAEAVSVFVSSFGQGVKEPRQHYSVEETHLSNAA